MKKTLLLFVRAQDSSKKADFFVVWWEFTLQLLSLILQSEWIYLETKGLSIKGGNLEILPTKMKRSPGEQKWVLP